MLTLRVPGKQLKFHTQKLKAQTVQTKEKIHKNQDSGFYVDERCINCDACRELSPDFFFHGNGKSEVYNTPKNAEQLNQYLRAELSCPVFCIHSKKDEKGALKRANDSLPALYPDTKNIYFCGYTDVQTAGGWSYLVTRKEGNVMIDAPRYNGALAKNIEQMGGLKYILLTHKDDVGDHQKWADRFGAQRVIHSIEVPERHLIYLNFSQPKTDVEIALEGEGPWTLDDLQDFEIVFTPGHSKGHICFFYKNGQALFTGDHLAKNEGDDGLKLEMLFNQYDPYVQFETIKKLEDYNFNHIFACHGRSIQFKGAEDKRQKFEDFRHNYSRILKL